MTPLICKIFEAVGMMVNTKKSFLNPTQVVVSGFSDQFSNNDNQSTIRKGQKDLAGSNESAQISVNFSVTPSCFIGKVVETFRAITHASTLQSSTKSTQFSNIRAQPP